MHKIFKTCSNAHLFHFLQYELVGHIIPELCMFECICLLLLCLSDSVSGYKMLTLFYLEDLGGHCSP